MIATLQKNEGGLFSMDTGGGKSIGIIGYIATIKQPTLILMNREKLAKQWYEEIKTKTEGSFILGFYGDSKRLDGDIVIGITNTVTKVIETDPSWLNKFSIIVLDEVQDCPAKTIIKILNNSPAKYRIGISATIERKDGMHILTYDIFGPLLMKIEAQEIKHRITNFTYEIINTNLPIVLASRMRWIKGKMEPSLDIASSIKALTESKERNDLIISKVIERIQSGYFPIILVLRRNHGMLISNHLTDLGIKNILILGGKISKKIDLNKIKTDDTIKCIVAQTTIMDKGIDIPKISNIHLTYPTSNVYKLRQILGRMRRDDGSDKLPCIDDYVDNMAFYQDGDEKKFLLINGARQRIRYYKKLIKEYIETE
jgi:superfamily II DNA or RNA helicase